MRVHLRFSTSLFGIGACVCGILVIVLAGCGSTTVEEHPQNMMTPRQNPGPSQTTPGQTGRVFTLQELATYNGQNGQPAYIAANGVVYDVTGQPDWPMGGHTPCGTDAIAGQDLTQVLNEAPPEMKTYVQRLPVVGTLAGQ